MSDKELRECSYHGLTEYYHDTHQYRCKKCNSERVSAHRTGRKKALVAYFGGSCKICGYSTYHGALHFHHVDPNTKKFGLARGGVTRSLRKCIKEAGQCVLVCSNCHAELHAGLIALPDNSEEAAAVADKLLQELQQKDDDRAKRKWCGICGAKKFKTARRCKACFGRSRERIVWPAYEELIEMVAKTSKIAVAKKLGVSESAVRKRIKNHSPLA